MPLQPISPHTIWSFGDLLLKIENEPAGRSEDAPSPAITLPDVVKNSFLVVIKGLYLDIRIGCTADCSQDLAIFQQWCNYNQWKKDL